MILIYLSKAWFANFDIKKRYINPHNLLMINITDSLVEMAGIEPASENLQSKSLHA